MIFLSSQWKTGLPLTRWILLGIFAAHNKNFQPEESE